MIHRAALLKFRDTRFRRPLNRSIGSEIAAKEIHTTVCKLFSNLQSNKRQRTETRPRRPHAARWTHVCFYGTPKNPALQKTAFKTPSS